VSNVITSNQAVRKQWTGVAALLLSFNPSLLYRENSTGRTPLEMSQDAFIASRVSEPPSLDSNYSYRRQSSDYNSIVSRSPDTFIPTEAGGCENDAKAIHELCTKVDRELQEEGFDSEPKRKRKLVSLFEANEVAHRLGRRKIRHETAVVNGHLIDEGKPDIVSEILSQYQYGSGFVSHH